VSVGVWADAQPDRLAPDFSLPAITDRNETITLSTYRGKAVYLDFWTSWCAPCRESLPLLGELHDQLAGEDFAIVTVNLDTYPADGRRLMNEFGIEYPVASDIAGVAADSFGAETLPAAYVIDGAGVIQPKLPRLNEQSMAEIKTSLLKLIEQERNTRPLVN
jgi:cytochrome c biogenesis protein CcmG/thiol:disulfide interchange protein DsbE